MITTGAMELKQKENGPMKAVLTYGRFGREKIASAA